MRTGMLAEELATRGHQVTWWASAFDHMSKRFMFEKDMDVQLRPNLVIKALKGMGYKENTSLRRYFDHALIARKFRNLARALPRPDLIVTSIPDHQLAYASVLLAKELRVPYVVDVRDQWPDIFLDLAPRAIRPLVKVALARDFFMLRTTLRDADAVLSMMSQLLAWGLNRAGRPPTWKDRVFYLGARRARPGTSDSLSKTLVPTLDRLRTAFVVIFIGVFGKYYDPTIIANAARIVQERRNPADIAYVIAGDGRFTAAVEDAARELENVILPGWLNQDEISALLEVSDVGVIPCSQSIDTFPNKAFTYLSAGLPVISSAGGDLRRLIDEPGIGLYYEPGDVDGLATCILRLYEDAQLRARFAASAQRVFDEKLDSDIIYRQYADHLEHLVAGGQPRSVSEGA